MKSWLKTPHRPIVNFLVCGTQKGGTTALDVFLRKHQAIYMAEKKEVHFFDKDKFFTSNHVKYSHYHSFFSPPKYVSVIGESTPIYMYWQDAIKRIWQYNPNMKLIAVLRNPVDRAFSHWNMERQRGYDSLPFRDAIESEYERCRDALPLRHRYFSYVDRGFYAEQIRNIWRFFPRSQTLFLKSEDLKYDMEKSLSNIADFLSITDFPAIKETNIHARRYEQTLSEADREYLNRLYKHSIRELEQMLGWDCSDWQ